MNGVAVEVEDPVATPKRRKPSVAVGTEKGRRPTGETGQAGATAPAHPTSRSLLLAPVMKGRPRDIQEMVALLTGLSTLEFLLDRTTDGFLLDVGKDDAASL